MAVKPTPPSPARDKVRAVVPKLIDLTEKVLFGDVWERPGLSKRDRSLITCAALVALNRTEQLKGHLGRALNNGVTPDEIGELITHLAFYGGWLGGDVRRAGRQGRDRAPQEIVGRRRENGRWSSRGSRRVAHHYCRPATRTAALTCASSMIRSACTS
jgi:4-carboxymuconolactone decarboxylase